MNGLKSRILFLVFVIFTISLIETIQIADAATFTVPGNHATIQLAIDNAGVGDIISVASGTYVENINIESINGLTIQGTDAATTIIAPTTNLDLNHSVISDRKVGVRVVDSTDITINNLTFDFTNMPNPEDVAGIMYADSTGEITNNILKGLENLGTDGNEFMVRMESSSAFDDFNRMAVLVQGNTLTESGRIGIYANNFVDATIDGNTITNNNSDFGYGIELVKRASGTITGNIISGFDKALPDGDKEKSAGIYFVSNVFAPDQVTPLTVTAIIDDNEVSDSVYGLYIGTRWCNLSGDESEIDLNAIIKNNNLHDNTEAGIRVGSCDAPFQSITVNSSGNTLDNNNEGYLIANGEANGFTDAEVKVTIDGDIITNHSGNGIIVRQFGDKTATPTVLLSSSEINILNTTFDNNGKTGGNNADLKFFEYEGNAKIDKVTINKPSFGTLGSGENANAIEFRGQTCDTGSSTVVDATSATGTIEFIDLTITGAPNKNGILIQCYADTSNVSFVDVDLTGITTADPTKFWPSSITLANSGTASTDIGNTKLNDLNIGGTNPVIATSADFGTHDNFEIERRVVHSVDVAGLSTVIWNPDNLYARADFVPSTWTTNPLPIQYPITNAITAASDGFTVNVKEGLYEIDSTITIDKPLTLLGPQADIDPRTAASLRTVGDDTSEAIIRGIGSPLPTNLLFINADDVTINGFEIQNGNKDLVYSEVGTIQNPKVSYNIIHDSETDEGIQLKETNNTTIEFNHVFDTEGDGINLAFSNNGLIQSNEIHDVANFIESSGIYVYNDANQYSTSDEFNNSMDIIIQNNLVYNVISNDGIKVGDRHGFDKSLLSNAQVLNNIIHDTEQDGITVYSSNVTVEGNEIFKSKSENGALYVAFDVANITIKDNNIHDNKATPPDSRDTYGIRIGGDGANHVITNVSVTENIVSKNTIGMIYESSGDATIDAKNNYWGSKKGPSHSNNIGGNGDEISGTNITFTPFYINAGLAILNTEVGTAPGEEKTIKPTKDKVTLDDGDDTTEVKGQAALPEDIVEIILKNNAVLDVNDNIGGKVGNNIEVSGVSIGLATFDIQLDDDDTTTDKVVTDLTAPKKVANVKVVVEKAVKLKSGIDTEPIIIKNIALPTVKVSIPDETTILAPAGWTGTIQPPKAASNSGTAPSGFSVGGNVIEVGSPDAVLLFDTPVTLTLEGVTGAVGYKPAGSTVWTQITESCGGSFDNPDAPSFFPGECFISDGSNTKIVTYHFTSFGGLSSTPKSGGGSSGDSTAPVFKSGILSDTTTIIKTGKTTSFTFEFYENSGPQKIQHVEFITAIDKTQKMSDSELFVEFDKSKDMVIVDKQSLWSTVPIVTIDDTGVNTKITFEMTFEKSMDVSDVILRVWDVKRNSVDERFENALQVIESKTTPTLPNDEINENPVLLPSDDSTNVVTNNYIKQWAGYSDTSITSKQLLEKLEIPGNNIPSWYSFNAKMVKEGKISVDEFVISLQNLSDRNILG